VHVRHRVHRPKRLAAMETRPTLDPDGDELAGGIPHQLETGSAYPAVVSCAGCIDHHNNRIGHALRRF
jgi:hypothetical protein